MRKETHQHGRLVALADLKLEKHAVLGSLWNAGRAALSSGLGRVGATRAGRALTPGVNSLVEGGKQLAGGVSKLTRGADWAVSDTLGRGAKALAAGMGKSPAVQAKVRQGTTNALKGVTREALTQAGAGGALVGGLGALSAEDGHKWDAFKSGFGTGATFGGLSGVAGRAVRNLRRGQLGRQAASQAATRSHVNAAGQKISPTMAAKEQLNQGMGATLRGAVTGQGPMGRAGNIADLGGVAAQTGAEWVLPGMALSYLGSGNPDPLPTPKVAAAAPLEESTPPDNSGLPKKYIGSLIGSSLGYPTGSVLANTLTRGGRPQSQVLRGAMKHFIPAATGVGGAITGYNVGKKYDAPPPPEKELAQIDFDKLLRYYKKKEDTGPGA